MCRISYESQAVRGVPARRKVCGMSVARSRGVWDYHTKGLHQPGQARRRPNRRRSSAAMTHRASSNVGRRSAAAVPHDKVQATAVSASQQQGQLNVQNTCRHHSTTPAPPLTCQHAASAVGKTWAGAPPTLPPREAPATRRCCCFCLAISCPAPDLLLPRVSCCCCCCCCCCCFCCCPR
jgi:hypothetical protein